MTAWKEFNIDLYYKPLLIMAVLLAETDEVREFNNHKPVFKIKISADTFNGASSSYNNALTESRKYT